MKKIYLIVFLLSFFALTAQEKLETYQRAKISFNQDSDLFRLQQLDIPADHGIKKKDHFIISDFSISELERARVNGFQVEVLIEDMRAHAAEQNRLNTPLQRNATCSEDTGATYPTPENFNLGSLGGYMTYQEFLDELDDMHDLYPNLITARDGISDFLTEGQTDTSVTPSIGGNQIEWVKISDNPNESNEGEAQILYTGIHHAREFATLSELIFYMWYLLENYETDTEIQSIVNNTELYFVPVVNPDGYLYNQVLDPVNGQGFWRKNRKNGNGVDNNRNYDYHINGDPNNGSWGGPGASGNPNSDVYHGPSAFSEVENQAIKWFVEQHNFVIALNNHSFGRLLYYPFGYADVATPDDALYQGIGAELTSQNGYNPLRDSPFSGDSDDFMYGTVGTHDKIFAFTPEINNSFYPASNQIEDIAREMMFTNLTAAKMTNNFATLSDTSALFIDSTTPDASFNIRRLGINGSGNFTVSINPVSTNITTVDSPVTFSGLATLEDQDGTIGFTLSNTITAGDTVDYELVVNNGSFDTSIFISKIFGESEQVFFDDGSSSTTNFETNDWGITDDFFESAPTSITDSPNGNYSNDENSSIVINTPVDLTDALSASVSFYARWDIENTWDYVQFEISTDNGTTWIPQCGNFTSAGTNIQPAGEPLYDGTQSDFVLEEISLSDYLGEEIIARFQLVSDDQVRRDGFYFDDLEFLVVNEEALSVGESILEGFTVFPNPVKDILTVQAPQGPYTTTIYNIQGQRVSETTEHTGSAQLDYSKYANGIYFVKIASDNALKTIKVIKE
ncbi:M14 family zinc carboxypeptidase [uncultured Dokdonia sp.]|uniref:M14 family zinc carboxypeptidase n=1 Tax=uncultured Dokdonia sp. TaxID=575653 RepID=UPI002615EBA2|nr:M14 family zinc carboxypeptidase [uncultured Dokdonia sp.]